MFKEYEEYFSTLEIDKSPHTVRSYKKSLGDFVEKLEINSIEDLKELKSSDIQEYLNYLVVNGNSKNPNSAKATANARYRVIKAFLNWLVSMGYMEASPTDNVKRYKESKSIPIIFTKEERDRIILATKKRPNLHMMIALLFYTGLRREEAVNAKISDIKEGFLLVHGKGNRERQLPLTDFVLEMIEESIRKRKDSSPYLLVSMRGGHQITPQALLTRVKVACRMAGIPEEKIKKIGAHTIRRSFACNLMMDGWSTFAISKALGHSNIMVTERYVEPAKSIAMNVAMFNQPAPEWYEEKV